VVALDLGLLPLLIPVAVMFAVFWLLSRRSSQGVRPFRAGFVTIVTGRKGHGKSIFAVHEMLRHVGQPVYCKKCTSKPELREQFGAFRGRFSSKWFHYGHVATNAALTVDNDLAQYVHVVTGWEELGEWVRDDLGNLTIRERLPHGTLLVIDEAHLWCPAKAGEVLPERQKLLLSQLRKLMVEAVFVTQNVLNVAVGLRRQTDEIGVCRKGMWSRMTIRFWDPEEVNRPGCKSLWRYGYKVTKRLAAAYDTFELIVPADDVDAGLPAQRAGRNSTSTAWPPRGASTRSENVPA